MMRMLRNPPMDVDASASEVPDYCDAPGVVSEASMVNLDEEPEVQSLLPTPPAQTWQGSTIMINPNFSSERKREWIDLVALDFVRAHQRRPDDPDSIYRIDEAESNRDGRLLNEPGDDDMNVDDEVIDDDSVMINNSYGSSIAVDAVLT